MVVPDVEMAVSGWVMIGDVRNGRARLCLRNGRARRRNGRARLET
jgi:hypothetical protein